METVEEILARARRRVAGSPTERMGDWASSRKLLGFGRAPRIVPVGDAWHVGVLLLTDEEVHTTGEVLRARQEVRRGFTAQSQRERAERQAAAYRGGFAEGEVVHVGWETIDLDFVSAGGASGALIGGEIPLVRWSPSADPRPLAEYLDEVLALR